MRLGTTILMLTLFITPLCTTEALGQSDPYLVQGQTFLNGEKTPDIQVKVILDRTGAEHSAYSDSNGTYVIMLGDCLEGESYTIRAVSGDSEFTRSNRIIRYDNQGYLREGDQIDIHLEKSESKPDNSGIIVFSLFGLFLLIAWGVFLRKK